MPTIRDVARHAGVSVSTVSHVMNETRYVSESVRERVQYAMTELNYKPNRLARSLRNRQTHTFGVLLPTSANPYFAEVLIGIETACFDHGFNFILGNANDDPQRELYYLNVLLSKQVDGVLLISTGAHRDSLALMKGHRASVVVVDRSPGDDLDVDTVLTDNEHGGFLATQYLLGLGHRRIGCILGPSQITPSADRMKGYRRALRETGVHFDEQLIVPGDFQHQGGYIACQQLLSLASPPTAIFAFNDLMAVGALRAIHEAGLRVPDQVSVIGFDDIALANYTVPRLTTIAQPKEQVGRVAMEMLIQRTEHPDAPTSHQEFSVKLVERDSCKAID